MLLPVTSYSEDADLQWYWYKPARHAFQASLRWHPEWAYAFLLLSKIFEICNMTQTICVAEAPKMCVAQFLFRWHWHRQLGKKKKILLYQAQSHGCKTTWKIRFLPSFCLHFSHWWPALTSLLAVCLFGCLQQPALQQAMNWQAIWN